MPRVENTKLPTYHLMKLFCKEKTLKPTYPVEMASTLALQKIFVTSHSHLERVHYIEAEQLGLIFDVLIVLS